MNIGNLTGSVMTGLTINKVCFIQIHYRYRNFTFIKCTTLLPMCIIKLMIEIVEILPEIV